MKNFRRSWMAVMVLENPDAIVPFLEGIDTTGLMNDVIEKCYRKES